MEQVTLTQHEQARLKVLNSLLADHMTIDQAATLMGVSTRHTRRLLAAYRKEGAAALAHGNRGRRPSNITSETTRSM
ncbi:MAG: helix-turn-helix domain-containing protein, partial [Dehalococcoidia bacterium]|nr:helix-turn-helix domain-containing protein [Dehalococcoidia bacterium]